MKKTLLILASAAVLFSCAKKETPAPAEDPQQVQNAPAPADPYADMVKVTTWSPRAGYTYRRKPYGKDWTETIVNTKTAVFYEVYCHCGEEIKNTEYALFASRNVSYIPNDSIRITVEYKGKKATHLNERGTTFAITHFVDMK